MELRDLTKKKKLLALIIKIADFLSDSPLAAVEFLTSGCQFD